MSRPARCPVCGFSFAWDGRRCQHCPPLARARSRWEQIDRFAALVYPERPITHCQLAAIVVGCLRRLDDGLPTALRALTDALDVGENLGGVATACVLGSDTADREWTTEIARVATGVARRAPIAELIGPVHAAAEWCRRDVGNRAFPPRDLFSFPLPQELEPYRAATAERVAANPTFGNLWWREGEDSVPEQSPTDHDVFCRTVAENLRQQSAAHHGQRAQAQSNEERAQCEIARDVLWYPGATVTFNPTWRTSTAVALAQGMHNSSDFFAMPILADALQEAGCDNDDILNHCRDTDQVHVRGCWVIDLVLGRE